MEVEAELSAGRRPSEAARAAAVSLSALDTQAPAAADEVTALPGWGKSQTDLPLPVMSSPFLTERTLTGNLQLLVSL